MTSPLTCPACTSSDLAGRLDVTEMMFGQHEVFSYAECGGCSTLWLPEVPADLGAYYPDDYYSVDLDPERVIGSQPARALATLTARSVLFGSGRLVSATTTLVRRRQYHTLVSLLRSVALTGLPGGRSSAVLDVGCGSGALVYTLGLGGMTDVTGVDPFAPGDRTFDTGGTLLRRELEQMTGAYDVVMFHHSLEHVLDPAESLTQARDLLSDRGRILVRMPTPSSAAYLLYGTDWVQLDAPRHTGILSRTGMAALCDRVGLEVVTVQDDSTSFQFWGSEQVKAGIALNAPTSHMVDPKASMFDAAQIRAWEGRAHELNIRGQGDQAVWVMRAR